MDKKQESLKKAKESGKKIIEGGKELGLGAGDVLGGTTKSIFYTLEGAGEAGVSEVSKKKSENLDYSDESRRKYKEKSERFSIKSKESFSKAGKSAKQAVGGLGKIGKGGAKIVGNTAKAGYHLVDAGDKAIGEKITERRKEKGETKVSQTRKFFRDNIMKLLVAGGLLGYGGSEAIQYVSDSDGSRKIGYQNHTEGKGDSDVILLIPSEGYDSLKRKPITTNAPLTRRYLGGDLENSGELNIGDTLVVNPAESLHNLRSEKIRKYGQSTKNISELDTVDVKSMSPEDIEKFRIKYPIDATYLFVVKPYTDGEEKKETMSLQEFIKQTNKIVGDTNELTNAYDGGLKGDKKVLFDAIRNNITGECIVAYAMTELCENKEDGEFNKELLDLMLRNYGANFIAKIPAIYDGKTSYGPYQFTEYALHDVGNDVRGASIVNRVVPKEDRIPGSVIDLSRRQDQTKAAYMFAIQNISTAVRKLTDQQAKDLLSYYNSNKKNFMNNMTQLIAMCHHLPVDANALKKWHEDKHKYDIYKYGKAQTYGKASKNNFTSLGK